MVEHYSKFCKICKKLMYQCKCMSMYKKYIYGVCEDCKKKEKREPMFNITERPHVSPGFLDRLRGKK